MVAKQIGWMLSLCKSVVEDAGATPSKVPVAEEVTLKLKAESQS